MRSLITRYLIAPVAGNDRPRPGTSERTHPVSGSVHRHPDHIDWKQHRTGLPLLDGGDESP